MGIVKNSISSFIFNMIGAAFGFLFQMIAAKYFGAYIFGQANYFIGYSATLSIFIGFGFQTYLPKYMNQYENKEKMFSEVFWTGTLLFVALCPLEYILLKQNVNLNQFILVILYTYVTFVVNLMIGYYIGLGRTQDVMLSTKVVLNFINMGLLVLIMVFSLKQYYLYLACTIIASLVIIVPFLIKTISKPKLSLTAVKLSFVFYLNQIVYGAFVAYSKVLQKEFGTFESVAVLSVALTLGNITSLMGDCFAKVSMPEFAKAWNDKNHEKLESTFKLISRLNCYLVLPIAVFAVLNSQRILEFLGKGYKSGGIILSMILISQFVNSFVGPNGTVLNMTSYSRVEVYNGAAKFVFSIILCLLFGKKYIWGIALAVAGAEIFVNILKTVELKKLLNILPYSFKNMIYIVILTVIQIIAFLLLADIKNFILWVIINGLAILIFYYISFRFSTEKEDKNMINVIMRKGNR